MFAGDEDMASWVRAQAQVLTWLNAWPLMPAQAARREQVHLRVQASVHRVTAFSLLSPLEGPQFCPEGQAGLG